MLPGESLVLPDDAPAWVGVVRQHLSSQQPDDFTIDGALAQVGVLSPTFIQSVEGPGFIMIPSSYSARNGCRESGFGGFWMPRKRKGGFWMPRKRKGVRVEEVLGRALAAVEEVRARGEGWFAKEVWGPWKMGRGPPFGDP